MVGWMYLILFGLVGYFYYDNGIAPKQVKTEGYKGPTKVTVLSRHGYKGCSNVFYSRFSNGRRYDI